MEISNITKLQRLKIGKVAIINGARVKAVQSRNGCSGCAFFYSHVSCAMVGACRSHDRKDKESVIFVGKGKKVNTSEADVMKASLFSNGEPFLIVETAAAKIGGESSVRDTSTFELIPLSGCNPVIAEGKGISIAKDVARKLIALNIHKRHANGYGAIYDFFDFRGARLDAEKKKDKLILIVKGL